MCFPLPLSQTLDSPHLVPSLPNPNVSFSGEPVTSDHAPPSPDAVIPPTDDIYSDIFAKEDPLEGPDPALSFRILEGDMCSQWTPAPAPSSSSSKESDSWLLQDSGSAVVSSRVGAGLWNLGNTCFLNATVQCFTHTVPLVLGLRSCSHSVPCDGSYCSFCVICALREQVECSLAASGGVLKPLRLFDNLNYFSSMFRKYQQEDAHEFMQCALDKLERCFIDLKKNDESFEDDNIVEKVFGGRSISKLQCSNCGHASDTYEPLIDLSLEIDNVDTLQSALESFTKVENIDDKLKCDSCKEEVSMVKQLMLDRTPSIAAFHLKRFKTDGTYVEKIDKHVNFPLELDLQPYTVPNQNNNETLKYELYAIVVHTGFSSTSGHYFCFVRSAPDTWHKLDDSKVTAVSEEYVLSQEAYILFYARQGTPWFSSIMESTMPCFGPKPLSTSPKSVLDIVDTPYKSNPVITANIERSEVREPKEISEEEQFDYSCQERLELHEINDADDASHDCKKFPSGLYQENVRMNCSNGTTTCPDQVPIGNNKTTNGDTTIHGNSLTESSHDENKPSNEVVVDFAEADGFHPLTPPGSPSPVAQDKSYSIPRDHLKMTKSRSSCKKSLDTHMAESERKAAVRYLRKNMPSARQEALMQCISEPPLNKKRKRMDSLLCKKGGPHSVPSKSSVMRPVVTGISR